jgi:hypothetical protein
MVREGQRDGHGSRESPDFAVALKGRGFKPRRDAAKSMAGFSP